MSPNSLNTFVTFTAHSCKPRWHWLRITAALETDRQTDRRSDRRGDIGAITVYSSVSYINTYTGPYLCYQHWPCSICLLGAGRLSWKVTGVLLPSPAKCQQVSPAPSMPARLRPSEQRGKEEEPRSLCRGVLKLQTSRGPRWIFGQCCRLCNTGECEGNLKLCDSANRTSANKTRCNWALLLSRFVYWSRRLNNTQKALWVLFFPSFFLSFSANNMHFFGVKENENREWMGGLWRVVSECADDKLGMTNIEHIKTERCYLFCTFGVVCGKETGLSVGNGFLLIQSWRSAVCYYLRWKSSAWFKEGKCRKRVFVRRPDLMTSPWAPLICWAFEDTW